MRVALAPRYRNLMFVLFPVTLGVGTAALWFRSLNWPLDIDGAGLRLRSRRYLDWRSIKKIGVSRSYRDGHVSQIRIHHAGGVSKIPTDGLEQGQHVARIILAIFEQVRCADGKQVATARAYSRRSEADQNVRKLIRFPAPEAAGRNCKRISGPLTARRV